MKPDQKNTALSNKNRGFSLIEVMIAMAVFSIGILAVGSMQLSNSKNNTREWVTDQVSGSTTSWKIVVTVKWTQRGPERQVVLQSITRGNGT